MNYTELPYPELSLDVWRDKYRFGDEASPEDTLKRVAAAVYGEPGAPFEQALLSHKFVPGGRILAGLGTTRKVTLSQCYVIPSPEDSIEGILATLREYVLSLKAGAGVGFNLSTLRPHGSEIATNPGAISSGPLSFANIFDQASKTIVAGGGRRGASMLVMDVSHPDIETFIAAKQTTGVLTQFNISVAVTDAFMQAVEADAPWDLTFGGKVYKTVSAKALWHSIMQSTYDFAEPGVLFIDRINQLDPLGHIDNINATNPCGEQSLPPYASCNLGAINLVPFVPFGATAHEELHFVAYEAVRFLDRVLDLNYYPFPAQHERAMFDRRIGLGIMGLGSALAIMGVPYGSQAAVDCFSKIMDTIVVAAQFATTDLASTISPCPAYEQNKAEYSKRRLQFLNALGLGWVPVIGARNSHIFTIAPTGNTSIFAKNVSGGIEPVFAPRHNRAVLQPDGTKKSYEVVDASLSLGASESYFTQNKATALPIDAHLNMLATAQKFIDNSVSKTINVASDISFEDFKGVYTKAYSLGCKGCTTYRPSEVRGAVLTEQVATAQTSTSSPTSRPRVLAGKTYKIRWDGAAYYVTINDLAPGRPFEFFINSKNKEDLQWVTALTRLSSAILRREGSPELLISEFKEVYGVGGEWEKGTFYSTIVNKLGDVLAEHVEAKVEIPSYSKCPKCGSHEIVHTEGCITCTACGYSKCG